MRKVFSVSNTAAAGVVRRAAAALLSLGVFVALVPLSVLARERPETLEDIINTATEVVGFSVPFAALFMLFMWSMWQVISNAGDAEKLKKARTKILWGIVALFAVFSLGGIIAVLTATLFPGS